MISVNVSMGISAVSTIPRRRSREELGPCPGSRTPAGLQVVEPDLGRNGRGGERTSMAKETQAETRTWRSLGHI